MTDVTRILSQIESGDPSAAEQLLPLVYDELRKLAAARLAHEKPGQTLQATALVHEVYLRLVDQTSSPQWDNQRHFFAAAAQAMRRILVEAARRKRAEKRGGLADRVDLSKITAFSDVSSDEMLTLNDAIEQLEREDRTASKLAEMRIFAGYTIEQAGKVLGLSRSNAYRQWTYTRAWLKSFLTSD
jgi:RNA polymerase sigma factor (TIGR02999 family)